MAKKASLRGIFVILVCMIAIPLMGCSDPSPNATEEQLHYLEDARANMLEVASFAMAGDANMDAGFATETAEMQMRLDGVYEKVGDGSLAEMHIKIEGDSSNYGEIDIAMSSYQQENDVYMTMNGEKWYRSDLELIPSGALQAASLNVGQFVPESFMMPIGYAQQIQVIAEDEDTIEFELFMGRDFQMLQSVNEAEQELGKEYDEFSAVEKKEVEMSVDMNVRYGRTRYFYIVDKNTSLLMECGSALYLDFRSPSDEMSISGEIWLRFSDYGKDFPIQVPQEAKDAEYLPPGTSIDM